jgi:hypothetical protein
MRGRGRPRRGGALRTPGHQFPEEDGLAAVHDRLLRGLISGWRRQPPPVSKLAPENAGVAIMPRLQERRNIVLFDASGIDTNSRRTNR